MRVNGGIQTPSGAAVAKIGKDRATCPQLCRFRNVGAGNLVSCSELMQLDVTVETESHLADALGQAIQDVVLVGGLKRQLDRQSQSRLRVLEEKGIARHRVEDPVTTGAAGTAVVDRRAEKQFAVLDRLLCNAHRSQCLLRSRGRQ